MNRSLLLASLLLACTSLDAREPERTNNADDGTVKEAKRTPPPKPEPKPEPKPAAKLEIAIASVQLDQDCPDPPSTPSSEAPAPSTPAVADMPPSPAKRAPSAAAMPPRPGASEVIGHRRACPQSTMNLKLTNRGDAEVKIAISGIALHDVQSKGSVGRVVARGPSAFKDGSYVAWNERVAAGGEINASYRLAPPDWGAVAGALGGAVDTRERDFELEVTFEIDGKAQTVRSPSFRRPPEIVMPPT